jgi:hypothetical protein
MSSQVTEVIIAVRILPSLAVVFKREHGVARSWALKVHISLFLFIRAHAMSSPHITVGVIA